MYRINIIHKVIKMKVEGIVTGMWGTKISVDKNKYIYGVPVGRAVVGSSISLNCESVGGRLLYADKYADNLDVNDAPPATTKTAQQPLSAFAARYEYDARAKALGCAIAYQPKTDVVGLLAVAERFQDWLLRPEGSSVLDAEEVGA